MPNLITMYVHTVNSIYVVLLTKKIFEIGEAFDPTVMVKQVYSVDAETVCP